MATDHEAAAAERARREPVRCAVLTVSDTRTPDNDESGRAIQRLLAEAGHRVVDKRIVRDEPEAIRAAIESWLAEPGVHCVLCTGGTGIARRDGTVEIVRGLLTSELEGFGELFRMLSYAEVGAAAMMSRAVGGLVARDESAGGDTFVFAMPGSVNAVETGTAKLLAPQLAHLVWERRR